MSYCGFKKGVSGNPNGRPKGAKNKVRFEVAEILKAQGCNPFVVLAQLALGNADYNRGMPVTGYLRKDAAAELCQYVAPKLKAVEHSASDGEAISVILNMGFEAHK